MIWDAYAKWRELVPMHEALRMSIDDKLQFLSDKQRIVELVHEYAFACDSRRWDILGEIYDDDIERIMSGTLDETVRGRDALIALHMTPRFPAPRASKWKSGT